MEKIKLQNILFNYDIEGELRSCYELLSRKRLDVYDSQEGCYIIREYTNIDFTTYLNCLQIERWKKYTFSKKFCLRLEVQGKATVELKELYKNSQSTNERVLAHHSINAPERTTVELEIPETDKPLVGFSITSLQNLKVYSACYMAVVDPENIRDVNISLVSTTFRKEEYILRNIKTLKEKVLFDGSDLIDHLHVNIIDNGRTLKAESINDENVHVYANKNVGGAGGFTRGMIESLQLPHKPTHVLLMDDDVLIMAESLFRTYYLLRILKPEYQSYFISGAMFDYDQRPIQYEDVGYVHSEDASYGPVKKRLDMRWSENLLKNEEMAYCEKPDSYAGWWYCCIPVAAIEKNGLPLPVFIRGDDVEFSIRNNAKFLTMNGICIWHVGFAGKFNAAMELYQVHRNSLVIQATSNICQDVDIIKRMKQLFWKEITRFAYNNAEQILDAVDDYMKGPEHLQNLNGETVMKEHGKKNDKLVSVDQLPSAYNLKSADVYSYKSLNKIEKMIYVVTLNGHLLPGFLLKNWPEVIAFDWFFVPGKNYLRKKLIALNPNDQTACVRIINRKRCFALIRHYRKTFKNYKKNCDVVAQAYRNNFEVMTSEVFWKGYLGL